MEFMSLKGKYHPLWEYLSNRKEAEVRMTFSQIEEIIGRKLPTSARTRRGWWSNRTSGALQAASWMKLGFHAEDLDLEQEVVTFRKPTRNYRIERQGNTVLWNGELVKALRRHMDLNQAEFATELGVRQQTVSEWETGVYQPKLSTSKYLHLVAERASFEYEANEEKED